MTAQHKVFVYPTAAERKAMWAAGDTSSITPKETRVFADLDEAIAEARRLMSEAGDAFVANVAADPDHCSLEDYLRADNTAGLFLQEHPQEGCFIGVLADADHFRNAYGVKTARELDDYLFWQTWSDAYRSVHGFRPRFTPATRAEAERLLDSYAKAAD